MNDTPENSTGQGGALRLTTARWFNRQRPDGKWAKILAHTGPYSQFAYGTDTPSTWPRTDLQTAIIGSAESGLIPVDVDDPEGFARSQLTRHISREMASTTRGDGFHVHLDARHIPRDQWPHTGPAGWSAGWGDIKVNGFVPVPSSIHYCGEQYAATGLGTVLATPGMIAAIQADLDAAPARESHGGQGGAGGGHDGEMAAYVLRLAHRDLDEDEVRTLWHARADAEQDDGWPFTEDDFQRHYRRASTIAGSAREGDRRSDRSIGIDPDTGTLIRPGGQAPARADGQDPAQPANLLARMKNGTYLNGAAFAPLHYHVDGLVPEGLTVLSGAPKVGKSWLVLGWLLDLARAGHVALYLALEDSDRRMQWRCRQLLGGDPVPGTFWYLTEDDVVPGMLLPTVEQFVRENDGRKPLIVVDTLAKAMQQTPRIRDEAPYERDYRVTSTLQALVRDCPGAGLVICHHDRKSGGEDWVDKITGTKGITGGPDAVVYLERKRNEDAGALHVTGKDIAENDYAVTFAGRYRWEFDGGSLDAAAAAYITRKAQAGLGDRSARIVAFVGAAGDQGVRAGDVAGEFGMSNDNASEYLRRLADQGRIKRAERGLYVSVSSVIFPVSPAQPSPSLPTNSQNSYDPIVREAGPPGIRPGPPGSALDNPPGQRALVDRLGQLRQAGDG